ncbi:T9SS type A sorting domain-containing protein [Aestuariivivens sediminicola]|uniref:T9SS type A sorting domain-containing protein n=1 Tax=Aestuariivivens sediminicola TaxID=2913560 RepID=UPI001F581B16|nr:T9SS type A sorting domain-containing protein [Aestuariivivens sediminicola]
MKKKLQHAAIIVIAIVLIAAIPTTIEDFFMPGSQPGQSGNIEHPNKCDNCHGGYDQAVEPAFNWRGSMMSQAIRDPLFRASLAIANQDAPDSGDLCIRCHAPDGWLNGRSLPTDGSALNNNDMEGVQCDFCHKLVKPTQLGTNPFPDNTFYTSETYRSDQDYLGTLTIIPPQSGNGMYIAHSENAKRGPFSDAEAKHKTKYSPFHSESDLCATCHDVSNPAFSKAPDGTYQPNSLGEAAPSFESYNLFPIERTYSEWKMSAYNSPEGVFSAAFGGTKSYVSSCQDCHMRDVSGYGANKRGIPHRNDLPLHDMTGGNTFMPGIIAELFPGDVDHAALLVGVERARYMLQNAATMQVEVDEVNHKAHVTITNETGHKLPSGYPEGRRIWLNVSTYDINGDLLTESGHYDYDTAVLTKDTKIYEAKIGMSEAVAQAAGDGYEAGESFHFVLNNVVIKDNRIPPRGFTNANFEAIQSPPVDYTYPDGQYYDITTFDYPADTYRITAKLFYQSTSKEFIEFLRDKNVTNSAGTEMYALWESHGKCAPELMAEQTVYLGEPPAPNNDEISVDQITLDRSYTSSKGGKYVMTATVTVADNQDPSNFIAGAEVFGQFSGPTSNSVSGVTDASGKVVFTATSKRANSDWCLDISNIVYSDYTFIATPMVCENQGFAKAGSSIEDAIKVYPNPSTEYATIEVNLKASQDLIIEAYDFNGNKVETLFNGYTQYGISKLEWNTRTLPKGIYFLKIHSNKRTVTKLILIN